MTITHNAGVTVVTGDSVNLFRLISIKHQLKLEKLGMKSRGGALRPRLAKEFGLRPRAPHADFIAYCEKKLKDAEQK
jgi:hypothetical protein